MGLEQLETLRRSLAMAQPDGAATALTNAEAVTLVERVQRANRLRDGLIDVLTSTRVSRENAHLRQVLSRLARLLTETGFSDDN